MGPIEWATLALMALMVAVCVGTGLTVTVLVIRDVLRHGF